LELRVARQPVHFGDDEHGKTVAAEGERGGELRLIGALSALHLMELRHHVAAGRRGVGASLALRLKAEARSPLAVR
jgi:hypothetical protein